MRIRCATPACNRSRNRALLLLNLRPELGIGKLQFSFLHKFLKHHNNQSFELQCHSLPVFCTGKKKIHKAHLLSSAVKKTIKYTCLQSKKTLPSPSPLPLPSTRHYGEPSLIIHLKVFLRLSKARLLPLPTLNRWQRIYYFDIYFTRFCYQKWFTVK